MPASRPTAESRPSTKRSHAYCDRCAFFQSNAAFTIIDADARNLARALPFVDPRRVEFVHARFTAAARGDYDAVVIPLSFDGDRRAIYARPPAPIVLVHDWIWRRRGESRIVSVALLKRINLVRA